MAISREQLSQVLTELKPALLGGRIQKIRQPMADIMTLEIRRPPQTVTLLISAHPQTARLHVSTQRLPNPATPPPFCQFLRSRILGAQIEKIVQVPDDRVVWFELSTKRGTHELVIALTGRSANLYLVDRNADMVRSLKPDSHSRQRVQSYLKTEIIQSQEESDKTPSNSKQKTFPLSALLEETSIEQERRQAKQLEQERQLATLRKAIKKTQRRVQSFTQDLEKAHRYGEHGRYGELLKAHLGEMKKGQTQIAVIDYYDDRLPELTLPLDPTKDPTWNLNDYFRKYRKFTGAER